MIRSVLDFLRREERGSPLAKVEIYTTPLCPYCLRAKALLKAKGVRFASIDVAFHPGRRREMVERARGADTVPQIFINGEHVGGWMELSALERTRRLDVLLEGTS